MSKSYRLTIEQVKDIRAYLEVHRWIGAQAAIARKYGISICAVNNIYHNRSHGSGVDGRLKKTEEITAERLERDTQ